MEKHYKREVSLMNAKIFPRTSLDKSPENPAGETSVKANPVDKSDQEVVNNVVSALKQTGTK